MAKKGFLQSLKRAFSSIKLKRCGKKTRRVSRKSKKSNKKRSQSGGGYTEQLNLSIYPGQQVHQAYGGPGYDCAGSPARPGALDSIGMLRVPGGLPGLSPGLFSGGGTQLGSGGIVVNPLTGKPLFGGKRRKRSQQGGDVLGVSVDDGSVPGTPSSGTPAQNFLQESQVGPNSQAPKAQTGGRYGMEMAPADLVLSPSNAVGMSGYAQNGRIPCEVGTRDALNPNPGGIQTASTLPSFAGVGNFTQIMKGGKRCSKNNSGPTKTVGRRSRKNRKQQKQQQQQQGGKKKRSRKQQGGVVVGQVDAMRYYAPTAGYDNLPLMPQVPNNPGILMQLGYPAGHFNPACMKTN
jgi:hypothetical protein